MDKLISEKAVLKLIRGSIYDLESFDENDALCSAIKRLPAIQLDMVSAYERGYEDCLSLQPERKTGRWKVQAIKGRGRDLVYCSECGFGKHINETRRYSYCPNCGAEMRGEQDE